MTAWLNSLPTWQETAEHVQKVSKETVDSIRKSAAATLRDTANVIEEGTKNTAAKMRDAAPWVAGEEAPPQPLVRDLRIGASVFRKGLPAELIQVDHGALVVRMRDTGNEVGTESTQVSLGTEMSQDWFSAGIRVCMVGLQNRAELNGCRGSLIDFKSDSQRWNVKLDSTGEIICANPANLSVLLAPPVEAPKEPASQRLLEVGMRVRLEGLENKQKLNGSCGMLIEYKAQTKRWNVKLESTGEVVCVHVRNFSIL